MIKSSVNTTRLIVFDTLAHANASGRLFGYGESAMVDGDGTRIKFGTGNRYSGSEPSGVTAKTFAQLPWTNAAISAATAFAANATATLTAAQLLQRYITSTSVAAVSLTLPTATLLGTALTAVQGTEFDFEIDNSAGANIVTVVVGTGITAATSPITGGATLTVAAGTFGKFKIIFKTATTALIFRTL